MRNLIVPCAGKSTRYPNMRPKWLLTHPDGQIMLEKAISSVDYRDFDRIYIVIVKQHDEEYDARLILKQVFPGRKFKVHVLDDFTSCVAETVYRTVKDNGIRGQIVIKDADNYVKTDYARRGNFVIGMNIEHRDVSNLSAKSFIIANESGLITGIIEKKVKSNIISLGVYSFESSDLFVYGYEQLRKDTAALPTKGSEIYISHVIDYCIGRNRGCFTYHEAEAFEDWGTLDDWTKVIRQHSTYFIDVDGVLLKNCGRYGRVNWSNNEEVLAENIARVKELATKGAQIVLVTSRAAQYRPKLERILKRHGVPYKDIITDCHHAPRVIINDFAPSNPYPSCEAVNMPRNGKLDDYLRKR